VLLQAALVRNSNPKALLPGHQAAARGKKNFKLQGKKIFVAEFDHTLMKE
jgi:hypothetical protein